MAKMPVFPRWSCTGMVGAFRCHVPYSGVAAQPTVREFSLFRSNRNSTVRIPVDFELPGERALMRKDGERSLVEPKRKAGLLGLPSSWERQEETVPGIADTALRGECVCQRSACPTQVSKPMRCKISADLQRRPSPQRGDREVATRASDPAAKAHADRRTKCRCPIFLNHALTTGPGTLPQFQALGPSLAGAPGQEAPARMQHRDQGAPQMRDPT